MKTKILHSAFLLGFFACNLAFAGVGHSQNNASKKHIAAPVACLEELPNIGDVIISPNPTSGDVKVEFNCIKNTKLEISLLNTIGKKLENFTTSKDYQAGKHIVTLKTSDLPQGLYFIEFMANGSRYVQRLFVLAN